MAGAFPQREFGQLKGQARLAKIAESKRSDHWGGSTWVYAALITNGASSGNHIFGFSPGEDNDFEILHGHMRMLDSINRVGNATIRDEENGTALTYLIPLNQTFTPAQIFSFPTAEPSAANSSTSSTRLILSGGMFFEIQFSVVAATQDTSMAMVCRVRGERPIVSLQHPADATVTERRNEFF